MIKALVMIGICVCMIFSFVIIQDWNNDTDDVKLLSEDDINEIVTVQDLVDFEIEQGRADQIVYVGNKINIRGEEDENSFVKIKAPMNIIQDKVSLYHSPLDELNNKSLRE